MSGLSWFGLLAAGVLALPTPLPPPVQSASRAAKFVPSGATAIPAPPLFPGGRPASAPEVSQESPPALFPGRVSKWSGERRATGGDYRATGGDYRATGGDYRATGGDYRATGGDYRATGGDYRATGSDYRAGDSRRGAAPDGRRTHNHRGVYAFGVTVSPSW